MGEDVMARLMSVEALPRGERLAKWYAGGCRRWRYAALLWERLFMASIILAAIESSLESCPMSLEERSARWRAYAAPLRKARKDRQATRRLFFETAAENQEMSAEIRTLRAALAKYGQHVLGCPALVRCLLDMGGRPPIYGLCDCGWDIVKP